MKTVETMNAKAAELIKDPHLLKLALWLIGELNRANGDVIRFQEALGKDPMEQFETAANADIADRAAFICRHGE